MRTETFTFDSQNRLTQSAVTGQTAQNFAFKANGNIHSKAGVGTYSYDGAGPHAVTGVTLGSSTRSYTYDAKGRMESEYLNGAGPNGGNLHLREIRYTSFDQPQFIQHWRSAPLSSDLAELGSAEADWNQLCTIQYYFGAGLQRIITVKHKGLLKTQTLSLGGYEIRETTRSGSLVEKEIRSSFGNGTKVLRTTATNPDIPIVAYEYSVTDHLGSDSVTYNGAGQLQEQRGHLKPGETQKTERQSYDAWGARRDGETWAPAVGQVGQAGQGSQEEEREGSNVAGGYTGHEMLDDVGLIHMNGRLYDPSLGRMCAADPYVQTPENLQNYNRYSYVLNNPLSQIDPSGHFIVELVVGIVVAIAGIIGGVIMTVVAFIAYLAAMAAQFVLTIVGLNGAAAAMGTMGASCLAAAKAGVLLISASAGLVGISAGKVALGAALGAVYSGAQAAINGGSFSDVLKAAAIGAVTGAVGAVVGGAMHGMGEALGSMLQGGNSYAGTVVHLAAHGAAGGGMSAAQGGSFKDGFIGGVIGGLTGGLSEQYFDNSASGILAKATISGVSGGLASVATGGKFSHAAYSAAFFYLFNNQAGRIVASARSDLDKSIHEQLIKLSGAYITIFDYVTSKLGYTIKYYESLGVDPLSGMAKAGNIDYNAKEIQLLNAKASDPTTWGDIGHELYHVASRQYTQMLGNPNNASFRIPEAVANIVRSLTILGDGGLGIEFSAVRFENVIIRDASAGLKTIGLNPPSGPVQVYYSGFKLMKGTEYGKN